MRTLRPSTAINPCAVKSRRMREKCCGVRFKREAITRLKSALAAIPNVAADPAPDVEILQFTAEGPLLCVRPYTHTSHYWQVYFDTHKAVVSSFGAAGYPVPETQVAHRNL